MVIEINEADRIALLQALRNYREDILSGSEDMNTQVVDTVHVDTLIERIKEA